MLKMGIQTASKIQHTFPVLNSGHILVLQEDLREKLDIVQSYSCLANVPTLWMQNIYGKVFLIYRFVHNNLIFCNCKRILWGKNTELCSTFHVYFYSVKVKTKKRSKVVFPNCI